jgi:hypothetical protein
LPLAGFPTEAFAWGLQTHLYFAEWLLFTLPLADPELRAAMVRFPRLVLAGACLPDLALAGKVLGTPAFRRAHRWATLRRAATAPPDHAACAIAIGYASHLVADIVAHNVFVPEHERRIARVPHITHAIAEFAMDYRIAGTLATSPSSALSAERDALTAFAVRLFPCGASLAERGIAFLARADAALRASPLPALCRRIVRRYYRDSDYRFQRYLEAVKARLAGLEAALAGHYVDGVSSDPEGCASDDGADRSACRDIARVVKPEHNA